MSRSLLQQLRGMVNKAPVAYSATSKMPVHMGPPSPTGLNAYGAVSTLFSLVRRLYTSVASAEWYMCEIPTAARQRAYGENEPPREVSSHPALDLWNNPNPKMTQRDVVETWVQHEELAGDGFLVIEYNPIGGAPLELWPLRPDRMTEIPSATDFLEGWEFTDAAGVAITFSEQEVLQLKHGPHPTNPYRGMGPVAALLYVLGAHRAAQVWNAMFFENGATPRGVWSIEDHVEDDEFDDFQRRLREQHRGAHNAHRDITVDMGAKYSPISINAKDMQLVEQFGVNRDIVLEAYGMSKTMLGVAESETNRATAETAEYVFSKYQLVERLDRLKDILNYKILPQFGMSARGVEFRYRDVVPADQQGNREDRDSRIQGAVALVTAGWAPEDALKEMGLPPMRWVGEPQEASA